MTLQKVELRVKAVALTHFQNLENFVAFVEAELRRICLMKEVKVEAVNVDAKIKKEICTQRDLWRKQP